MTIAPTITASNSHTYRHQLERIEPFAGRIHIDLADEDFTGVDLIDPSKIYWHEGYTVDIHLMTNRPADYEDTIIRLQPDLIVVHVEAEGLDDFIDKMNKFGIKVGLAILQQTKVSKLERYLDKIEHVLIFSGKLGHHGGSVDLRLLEKVNQAKQLDSSIEIGWDGGVSQENIGELAEGGVDVFNAGGAIQNSDSPQEAYAILKSLIAKGE